MFTLNIIWTNTITIYLPTSTYVNFFAWGWEGGLKFRNTAQLVTIFRNKGALT